MTSTNTIRLDELAAKIKSSKLTDDSFRDIRTRDLWTEESITKFANQSLKQYTLCGDDHTNIITYSANYEDPQFQDLEKELLETYTLAEDYLKELLFSISKTINDHKSIISSERKRIQQIAEKRARLSKTTTTYDHIAHPEINILALIRKKLPQDVIRHISSYLPQAIVLCCVAIPTQNLGSILSSLKLKNLKNIYNCENRSLSLRGKLYYLFEAKIIRRQDYNKAHPYQRKYLKPEIVKCIIDKWNAFNVMLNAVSYVTNPKHSCHTRCLEAKQMIEAELTYIYKLITFASKPEINARAKSKPKPKVAKPEDPIQAGPQDI
jgi:hypothetical protein